MAVAPTGGSNLSVNGPLLPPGTDFNSAPSSLFGPPSGNTDTPNTPTDTTGGGLTGGSGSSGGATTPTASPIQGNFDNALNNVIGYYNQILGNEDAAAGSSEANIKQGYNSQLGNLGNSYAQAQAQVPWQLVGRGAGSSSWAQNDNDFANNAYQNSLSGIQSNETSDLSNLEKQRQSTEGEGNYFVNTEAPQLRSLFPNLDAYYQNAQVANLLAQGQQLAGQAGGNQSIGALEASMRQNPSYNQSGSAQIQNLISQLAGSGAPTAIQNQIISGLGSDPNNPISANALTNLQPPQPVGA